MSLYGIDLGGTKIEGAVIDPKRPDLRPLPDKRPRPRARRATRHIIGQISAPGRHAGARLRDESGRPGRIGVGTPGVLDPHSGLLKNSNTLCLNGRPLQDDLAEALGTEVRTANDANCFALAEALYGAGRNRKVVVGLILGTGCGGGVVVGGRVLGGLHGIAGEWGHNPLRGERTPCYCGRKGCIETVIAGPALEKFYTKTGGNARMPEIARRAGEGEAAAAATLRRLRR